MHQMMKYENRRDCPCNKKQKYRVVTDEQLAFMLYKGELSRYRLKENGELSAEIFQEIFREILVKRAKLRAMHLLTRMDYTEAELEKKLMKGEYTPQAVKIGHGLCTFVPLS